MYRHYHAASCMTDFNCIVRGGGHFALISYAYFKRIPDEIIKHVKSGRIKLMADSGAFTNFSKPGKVTIEGYMEWLKEYKHLFDEYVTMDNLRNRDQTIKNYERLRKEGFNPLFVDHMIFRESDAIKPYYKKGNKLCWGGMVHYKPPGSKDFKLATGMPPFVKARVTKRSALAAEAPQSSLHLLGVGMKIGYFLPWFHMVKSFDSTAYLAPGLFGRDYAIELNDNKWPKIVSAKTPEQKQAARDAITRMGMDPNHHVGRKTLGVKMLEKYYKMLWDRYVKAREANEQLEVGMHKDEYGFDYSPEDFERIYSFVANNIKKEDEEQARSFSPVIATNVQDKVDLTDLAKRDPHNVSDRGGMFRHHSCYYPVNFPTTKKMNGEKCKESATKAIIWADGRAFMPVCEAHVEPGFQMLREANGEWAEIVGTRKLPKDREQGIEWWHQAKHGRAWHKEMYPSRYTEKADWTTSYINDLPDSAFLYIESGGEKDRDGKTVPRTLRHWPVRNHQGNLDPPHIRNALARMSQTKVPLSAEQIKEYQDKARALLEQTQKVTKIIEHREDGLFCVLSEDKSQNFGCYKTEEEAQARLRQVEYFANKSARDIISKSSERIDFVKTQEERFVLGIVLEPNDGAGDAEFEPDSQKDIYSADEVRQTEQKFMEDFQNIGVMHRTLVNGKVKILESYIAPVEFFVCPDGEALHESELTKQDREKYQRVKKGTWLLGLRIVDNDLWKGVKSGKLRGLSIGGSARRVAA